MYCSKVGSDCIKSACYAYKVTANNMQCSICGQKFTLGGSCSEFEHKRNTEFISADAYCQEYNCKILD